MAVAHDNASSEAPATGSASRSHNHTTNSATNSAIILVLMAKDGTTVSTPTCDGVSMTLIGSLNDAAKGAVVFMYGLCGQAAGTNTLSVTITSAAPTSTDLTFGVESVTGADQSGGTTTFRNFNSASNTTSTPSVTITSATGEFVVNGCGDGTNTAPTVGGTAIQRWNLKDGGSSAQAFGSTDAGAASVTMSWTGAGTSMNIGWLSLGVSIKASVASTAAFHPAFLPTPNMVFARTMPWLLVGKRVPFNPPPVTYNQALTATATSTSTFTLTTNKIVSATSTSTASIVKSVGKKVTATSTSTASIVKSVGKILSATATSTASMLTPATRPVALTATVTSTATLVKSVGKKLTATATSTASIVRQVNKIMSATATSTASIVKSVGKFLTGNSTSTVTMTRRVNKSMNATSTSTATVSALKAVLLTMTANATVSATMSAIKVAANTLKRLLSMGVG